MKFGVGPLEWEADGGFVSPAKGSAGEKRLAYYLGQFYSTDVRITYYLQERGYAIWQDWDETVPCVALDDIG